MSIVKHSAEVFEPVGSGMCPNNPRKATTPGTRIKHESIPGVEACFVPQHLKKITRLSWNVCAPPSTPLVRTSFSQDLGIPLSCGRCVGYQQCADDEISLSKSLFITTKVKLI